MHFHIIGYDFLFFASILMALFLEIVSRSLLVLSWNQKKTLSFWVFFEGEALCFTMNLVQELYLVDIIFVSNLQFNSDSELSVIKEEYLKCFLYPLVTNLCLAFYCFL